MRDALRVLHSVRHANRTTLRYSEQCERSGWIRCRDYGLQILYPMLKREIADLPICHTTPALVVTHEAKVIAEETNPVSPDRTLPFIFEMREPVRGLDEHWSRAGLGPSEPHS